MMTPPRSISARPALDPGGARGAFGHGRRYRPSRSPRSRCRRSPAGESRRSATSSWRWSGGAVVGRRAAVGRRDRRRGHVDRAAAGSSSTQVRPGPQRDRAAGGVDVLRRLGLVGSHPPSGAHDPVAEDPRRRPRRRSGPRPSPVYCVNWTTTFVGAICARRRPRSAGRRSSVRFHVPVARVPRLGGVVPVDEPDVGSRSTPRTRRRPVRRCGEVLEQRGRWLRRRRPRSNSGWPSRRRGCAARRAAADPAGCAPWPSPAVSSSTACTGAGVDRVDVHRARRRSRRRSRRAATRCRGPRSAPSGPARRPSGTAS